MATAQLPSVTTTAVATPPDSEGKVADDYVPWPVLDKSPGTAPCKYVTRGNMLGDGHFSVVKECMNVYTKDLYAMKLVHKSMIKGKLPLIQREVKLLRLVSDKVRQLEKKEVRTFDVFEGHHHVLQLFDFFETSESIALITQLCEKGDLYEKIIDSGSLDLELQAKSYCACLLSVLEFLHANGVVHRDLKAENVLFRSRVNKNEPDEHHGDFNYDLKAHDVILADFGLATQIDSNTSSTCLKEFVGTMSYIAPEIVRCKGVGSLSQNEVAKLESYSYPVDIWALGVLTYFMALGYTPFDCDNDEETLECIQKVDYYVDEEMRADPKMKEFWSFLQCCFIEDPAKRPSAALLKHHPFVKDFFATSAADANAIEIPESLKRSGSTSSLHSLRQPSRSTSSSTLAYLAINNNTSPSITAQSSKSGTPLYLEPRSTRDRNLRQVRETLRKTLSMTSLRNANASLPTVESKLNSTFVLEPKPPTNSLMNGCYSTTPESKSNLSTPKSLSRQSSTNSVYVTNQTASVDDYMNDDDDDEDMGIMI